MRKARWVVATAVFIALSVWTGALDAAESDEGTTEDAIGKSSSGGTPALVEDMFEPSGAPDTVYGWVVDPSGWLDLGHRGTEYRDSIMASAKMGSPLVILTDNGSVIYPVTMKVPSGPKLTNGRLMSVSGEHVMVTGTIYDRGRAMGIVLDKVTRSAPPKVMASIATSKDAGRSFVARVTDMSCWLARGDSGAAHAQCAQTCAKDGDPLVLVGDSGYMYYPVTATSPTGPVANSMLMNYCEQTVRVKGTVIQRGMDRAIVLESVAAYAPGKTETDYK